MDASGHVIRPMELREMKLVAVHCFISPRSIYNAVPPTNEPRSDVALNACRPKSAGYLLLRILVIGTTRTELCHHGKIRHSRPSPEWTEDDPFGTGALTCQVRFACRGRVRRLSGRRPHRQCIRSLGFHDLAPYVISVKDSSANSWILPRCVVADDLNQALALVARR